MMAYKLIKMRFILVLSVADTYRRTFEEWLGFPWQMVIYAFSIIIIFMQMS